MNESNYMDLLVRLDFVEQTVTPHEQFPQMLVIALRNNASTRGEPNND
ncbi:MAG TPA: hypothetical protein VNM92_03010 [Thermoanaerobaculia bacterium]|nr:hypothetical protein [Thermoanaerobaculia bacterium]